jgi:hypothetical protein
MLKPGGFLLTNNELPMRAVGVTPVRYADRAGAGDSFLWYQRQ